MKLGFQKYGESYFANLSLGLDGVSRLSTFQGAQVVQARFSQQDGAVGSTGQSLVCVGVIPGGFLLRADLPSNSQFIMFPHVR